MNTTEPGARDAAGPTEISSSSHRNIQQIPLLLLDGSPRWCWGDMTSIRTGRTTRNLVLPICTVRIHRYCVAAPRLYSLYPSPSHLQLSTELEVQGKLKRGKHPNLNVLNPSWDSDSYGDLWELPLRPAAHSDVIFLFCSQCEETSIPLINYDFTEETEVKSIPCGDDGGWEGSEAAAEESTVTELWEQSSC